MANNFDLLTLMEKGSNRMIAARNLIRRGEIEQAFHKLGEGVGIFIAVLAIMASLLVKPKSG